MIQLKQEQELLEGYRKLQPEAQRRIMDTVITAATAESAVKRQYGLPMDIHTDSGKDRTKNREGVLQ